jgi:GntR family transcriptional regulator
MGEMLMADMLKNKTIDKKSYIPIYVQLKDLLKETIVRKDLKMGQKVPSENDLVNEFNISRMTVRQAIKELEREGYVHVKRGEGTFVKQTLQTQMLVKLDGFSREMYKLGYKTDSKLLEASPVDFSKECEAAYKGLNEKAEKALVRIKRIRFLEGKPYAIETSYLNSEMGEKLLAKDLTREFSIYQFIEKELSIHLSRAEHIIKPDLAKGTVAALLKIREGSPVLIIKGTTFSKEGKPIEYLEGIYQGDEYKLSIEISK